VERGCGSGEEYIIICEDFYNPMAFRAVLAYERQSNLVEPTIY
jgi:hypothetical protein